MAASASPGVGGGRVALWRFVLPMAIGAAIAVAPVPAGLTPNAWRYFALFVAVMGTIITEPLAPAALGLVGVAIGAAFGLVRETPTQNAQWALSGFSNTTVWLIFGGYMFTLGYSVTGLGRRIALHLVRLLGRRTLGLGYALALADLALAPFTASAAARSAGTVYPVVRHIPELYDSRPDDGTARRLGSYLLYTALAASFITSSMFVTALAPNQLALSIIQQTTGLTITWTEWFIGFLPVGVVLLAIVPLLLYVIYPPEITEAPAAPRWASDELRSMGPMSRNEKVLLVLVVGALAMWVGAAHHVEPVVTAMIAVVLMVGLRVVSWEEMMGHAASFNVLVWFATLVTLASGLAETKFVDWLARSLAPSFSGLGPYAAIIAVVGSFYVLHYFFASITAHTTSLLPVFLSVAIALPGATDRQWALFLSYSLGLTGALTAYAAGQNVIYYGSGYISRRHFWVLGAVLGAVYLTVYLAIIVPWLSYLHGGGS
jgi:L-tartrate/succinate antiporter